MRLSQDVIVIGGGAAGLFCAFQAGLRGRNTLVIEHTDKVGSKIAISGGGRCNFTNLNTSPENFICGNPRFNHSALTRFAPDDFLHYVKKHGIRYHEKTSGRLFCAGSARAITQMLLDECAHAGVEIRTACQVRAVGLDGHFKIETSQGTFNCSSLVMATGGLSLPKLGAGDFGYHVARQFGLRTILTRPALVPFTVSEHDRVRFGPLSGISFHALVRLGDHGFREQVLITHRGLSGPAILQISSYWKPGDTIELDLLPDMDVGELLTGEKESGKELKNVLGRYWPRRFAQAWTESCGISKPLRQLSKIELAALSARLHHWKITPAGTEGYGTAEVTAGGVDTDELSSKTMAARRVPGLYFIGEVVDVTGQLGGFNFQWAWASGFAAGQSV